MRGERPLGMAEGTPYCKILFLFHHFLYNMIPNNAENMTDRCVPHNIGIVRAITFVYMIMCADCLIIVK